MFVGNPPKMKNKNFVQAAQGQHLSEGDVLGQPCMLRLCTVKSDFTQGLDERIREQSLNGGKMSIGELTYFAWMSSTGCPLTGCSQMCPGHKIL